MNIDTVLAILQQSEYDLPRLKRWLKTRTSASTPAIEPEKWTHKLSFVKLVTQVFFFLPLLTRIALALDLLFPFEWIVRHVIYTMASIKLGYYKLRGLKVVAIAGSYGKTSTKTIIESTYSSLTPTLMTPKSINTLLGISQIILSDLKPEHKLFLVEFGEYHLHDIPQLTKFVKPHYGILTPIGRQHLELLGSFKNVLATFSHFLNYFDKKPDALLVAVENAQYFSQKLNYYGTAPQSVFRAINVKVSRAGTEFECLDHSQNATLQVFSPLFGEHQAVNTLPALWLAHKLKISQVEIIKKLRSIPYISRRHEPMFLARNVLILDNSYNTNADSVTDSLKLLNHLDPARRLIVTLGFTELGDEAEKIHYEFGRQLADQVDYVGLIEAPWTSAIIEGFTKAGGNKNHIVIGKTQTEAYEKLQQYIIPNSIVLFEGGYREVYV
ncbi:MAG TPA: Mur ligase family protein [Patescibacteria group bacterium]